VSYIKPDPGVFRTRYLFYGIINPCEASMQCVTGQGGWTLKDGLGQQDRCAFSNYKGYGVKRRIPATWMSGSKKTRVSIGRKRKPVRPFFKIRYGQACSRQKCLIVPSHHPHCTMIFPCRKYQAKPEHRCIDPDQMPVRRWSVD